MKRKVVPNIVRGGVAIPLKNNIFLLKGRTHEQGGIDIGRTLEAENNELIQMNKKDVKIFSSLPFLNGKSPAQRVMSGENPNAVFNAQESFKRRNKINDDGTKKKRMGGDDIQDDGKGGLIDMSNPKNYKNGRYMGSARAEERGDTIHINSIQDGLLFSEDYKNYYPGFPKTKRMGGLSRSKDYGSKSKPYPNVKSGDFAGGHRSYPIPTKADARDALRLAGLHGRSDVKAKVYRKYPELRKKAKAGGLYSLTVNGETTLHQFPSTGKIKQSAIANAAERSTMKYGGRKRMRVGGDETQTERARKYTEKFRNSIPNSSTTAGTRSNSRFRNFLRNNIDNITDGLGLLTNIGLSIVGRNINNRMLNSLRYTNAPIPQRAAKLKTRININPQLDRMRESLASYEHNIDANTGSSQIALARKQRARLADVLGRNELYGDKENKETELINTDRINQQEVANKNIEAYNNWAAGKAAFENSIAEQKANNRIAAINNINAGVQQIVSNIQQRMANQRTLAALTLGSPNLPAEMFYGSGIWNKRMYDLYRRSYPFKRK